MSAFDSKALKYFNTYVDSLTTKEVKRINTYNGVSLNKF